MIIGLAAPTGAGPQPRASVRLLPRRPLPLPGCVIDAIPGHPASEHIIGIYLSHECLARRGLHPQFALRRYISLKVEIERREPRHAVVDDQNRCHPIILGIVNLGRSRSGQNCHRRFHRRKSSCCWATPPHSWGPPLRSVAEAAVGRTQPRRDRDWIDIARKSVSSVPPSGHE